MSNHAAQLSGMILLEYVGQVFYSSSNCEQIQTRVAHGHKQINQFTDFKRNAAVNGS